VNEERRCLVIDEHPTVRLGIRGLLGDRYEVEEAGDAQAAIELMTALGDFDVAVVELRSQGGNGGGPVGIRAIRALRRARSRLGIVAHGMRPERHAATEAIEAGATAYVAKCSPAKALLAAIDAAADAQEFVDPAARDSNGHALTRRQREILQLYADGLSTGRAAEHLGLSTETIRTHTKAALSRLEAHDRAHAVAIGLRSNLIE
jgi:DNA-binding NarL/FixJ family response regulator